MAFLFGSSLSIADTFKAVYRLAKTNEFEKGLKEHFQKSQWGANWFTSSSAGELSNTPLSESIEKIKGLYLNSLKELSPQLELFHRYLLLSCNENIIRIPENDLQKAKDAICSFYDSTHTLTKLIRKVQTRPHTLKSPIRENLMLFSKMFGFEGTTECPLEPWIGKYTAIIALEGISNSRLPYALLKWVSENFACHQDRLDHPEKIEALSRYLTRLQRAQDFFTIKPFHKGLAAVVAHLNAHQTSHPSLPKASLVYLEDAFKYVEALQEERVRNWGVFFDNDKDHLEWRASLVPGDQLDLEGTPVVLGQAVHPKSLTEDHFLVFEIVGNPDSLVWIGPNKAILHLLKDAWRDKPQVPSFEIEKVEPKGRFAIIEKLYPINYDWTSTKESFSNLAKIKETLAPIVSLVRLFIEEDRMPSTFSLPYLMLDKKGQLRSLIESPKTYLQPKLLDDFLYEVASGNTAIYLDLLEATGLRSTKLNEFYVYIMKRALKGEEVNFNVSAASENIVEPDVIRQSEKLYHEVIHLRDELKLILQKKHNVSNPKSVLQILDESILEAYKESRAFGRFLPSLKDEIEAKIVSKAGL